MRVGVVRMNRRRGRNGERGPEERRSPVTNNRPKAEIAALYLAMNYRRRRP